MGNVHTAARAQPLQWEPTSGGELVDLGRPYRTPLAHSRLQSTPKGVLSQREKALFGALALVLHGAAIYWLSQNPTPPLPVVPPEVPPMTIEFSQPAPPVVEPPPPEPAPPPVVEPPPPVKDELATKPAPKPVPKPRPVIKQAPKPAPKPVAKPIEQPPAPQPAAAPAPPAPQPVTPASASAGYLRNPPPEYPALAMRRNWQGTVLLRVHVLASGKPGDIQIQKSSGRTQLDEAALAAVKRWTFVPAKQGDIAQDGWVSVPIDFKLN